MASNYTEASIKTLSSTEHIRLRPGMYIGRLGSGTHAEDGIYVLLKETIDNSIDEFMMGSGKKIEVEVQDRTVRVREERELPVQHTHERLQAQVTVRRLRRVLGGRRLAVVIASLHERLPQERRRAHSRRRHLVLVAVHPAQRAGKDVEQPEGRRHRPRRRRAC